MKRLWIVLLLCMYGFSTSQAAFYIHYCCGELEAVAMEMQASSDCMDHMEHAPNVDQDAPCCQDNTLDTQQASSQHTFSSASGDLYADFAADLPVTYLPALKASETDRIRNHACPIHPVVPDGTPPIFLKNCIFII